MRIFYGLSYFIVQSLGKTSVLNSLCPKKFREDLRKLYPTEQNNLVWKRYLAKKISLVMIMIAVGSIMAIGLEYQNNEQKNNFKNTGEVLKRNTYGEDEREVELQVSIEEILEKQDITIVIDEQKYSRQQIDVIFKEIGQDLHTLILGNNSELSNVRMDLELLKVHPFYPVQISWNIDPYQGINGAGELQLEELAEAGEAGLEVRLDATLKYYEYEKVYSYIIHLYPAIPSDRELEIKRVLSEVQKINQGMVEDELLRLPHTIDGKEVTWTQKENSEAKLVFTFSIILAAVIYIARDQDVKKQLEERNRQLIMDYPKIVGKLQILLGAGMNIQGAFTKIAMDYESEKKRGKTSGKVRFAYEEMMITIHEMQSGNSEAYCYEIFGQRCKQSMYIKLGVLLSQHLKKGTRNLSLILEEEMRETFDTRKNLAKKLGEEAGTKLLIPMMLMLIIVLIILIFPAIISFQM